MNSPSVKRPRISKDNAEQKRLFIEKARELGCDDDTARFEKRLGKIAKAKPKDEREPKK